MVGLKWCKCKFVILSVSTREEKYSSFTANHLAGSDLGTGNGVGVEVVVDVGSVT